MFRFTMVCTYLGDGVVEIVPSVIRGVFNSVEAISHNSSSGFSYSSSSIESASAIML